MSDFTDLMFSSKSDKWDTPKYLVHDLSPHFSWDLDVCASGPNVCQNWYSEEENGLIGHWYGLCWMNPPYGREIGKWVQRARKFGTNNINGISVVCLLPARTGPAWWQDNVPRASFVVFVRGRFTFGSDAYWRWRWETPMIDGKPNSLYGRHGTKNSAPFDSAFVVFGEINTGQKYKLSSFGWSVP